MDPEATEVVLGLSVGPDGAAGAALVRDGEVVAAAAEGAFTGRSGDRSLPARAAAWCLEAGLPAGNRPAVSVHGRPLTTLRQMIVAQARSGPRGLDGLSRSTPQLARAGWRVTARIERMLVDLGLEDGPLAYVDGSLSQLAATFGRSPFPAAAVLAIGGADGSMAGTVLGQAAGRELTVRGTVPPADGIGRLGAAITNLCGFEADGTGAVLRGLAPFGTERYVEVMREHLVTVADDGATVVDRRVFDVTDGALGLPADLLGGPARRVGSPLGQREADLARSFQLLLEEVVSRSAVHLREITGERRLCVSGCGDLVYPCLAGLVETGTYDHVWTAPDGDAVARAVGAALCGAQGGFVGSTAPVGAAAFTGPRFEREEVVGLLRAEGIAFEVLDGDSALAGRLAERLAGGALVGWVEGAMEVGGAALGHRSVLIDPTNRAAASRLRGSTIDPRIGWPFTAAIQDEHVADWFDLPPTSSSAHRAVGAMLRPEHRATRSPDRGESFADRVARVPGPLPACTHIDGSVRVLTIDRGLNPGLARLLEALQYRGTAPILAIAPLADLAGQPVRTPAQAIDVLRRGTVDLLVIEGCVLEGPTR